MVMVIDIDSQGKIKLAPGGVGGLTAEEARQRDRRPVARPWRFSRR